MNILYTDPLYHNILYSLSIPDIYRLKCVCSSYYKNIKQSFINQITIKNIKKALHLIYGDEYGRNIKHLKQVYSNKIMGISCNKYFVISVASKLRHLSDFNCSVHELPACNLHIKRKFYDINIQGYKIVYCGTQYLFCESFNANIYIQEIKKQCWGRHDSSFNLYWIENDSDKPFNLLDHL